ncbi:MAG: hypothetical protein AAF798_02625 [Bacteroidota bacterium]
MEAFHAVCEDYRASKGIDIEHNKTDSHLKVNLPSRVIGGKQSNSSGFDYPKIWSNEIEKVSFLELDCGYFVVKEKPMNIWGGKPMFLLSTIPSRRAMSNVLKVSK